MVGEIDIGQTGKGLVGRAEGEVLGGPPRVLELGKNVSCSSDIWQVPRKAGARNRLMRSMHTNWSLPSLLEIRTSSTGHLAGVREAVVPFVCLWAGTNRMCLVGIWSRISRLDGSISLRSTMGCLPIRVAPGLPRVVWLCLWMRRGRGNLFVLMSPGSYSVFATHDPVSR